MTTRSISVTLKANIAGYMASLKSASTATNKLHDTILKNQQAAEHVGRGMMAFGTATLAGLALATKAAIDWESAWTGVTKTVDGSATQMAALEGQLRDMAKSLPVAHDEIASVAEAAGQLGIKRESIAEFSRVMIDLGETTNLSADEASTALARLMNVMGTNTDDVDRLGSTIVELGNNSATTEAEITTMATRLAGAGALIGATESDILGMSAAMSSVGITAELGGSAMSRVLQDIFSKAKEGGDAVAGFAKVAGMSAQEFTKAFGEDPAAALETFLGGLNRIDAAGGNVVGTLTDLGIKSSEEQRVLLALKGASDLLSRSLDTGAQAWEDNSALAEEAQKRYDTAAAQIKVAWNQIQDAAIDVGSNIAPIVGGIADAAGDVAGAFSDLPGPVKTALTLLGGVAGAVSFAGGAMLLMLPRIAETKRALQSLNLNFKGVAKGAGLTAAAFVALQGAGAAINSIFGDELNADIDKMADGLERLADTGRLSGEAARILGQDMGDLGEAFGRLTGWDADIAGFFERTFMGGLDDTAGSIANTEQRISALDESLAQLVEGGNAQAAQRAFFKIAFAAAEQGVHLDEVRRMLPQYGEALKGAEESAGGMSGATDHLVGKVNDAEAAFDDAKGALEEYMDAQRAAVDPVFALRQALGDVSAKQRAYNEAVREHGPQSRRARNAAWQLAGAVSAAEQAALDGDLSFKAFKGKLREWVAQGLITQGQADTLAGRVSHLRGEAENYQGDYAADLHANTRQASSNVSSLQAQVDRFAASSASIRLSAVGTATFTANVVGLPPGVKASPGAPPLPFGADGGLLTAAGLRRLANGGLTGMVRGPGGPRDDKILARLSNREFVVNADATARHLPLLQAINSGKLPGFHRGGMVRAEDGSMVPRSFYDRRPSVPEIPFRRLRDGMKDAMWDANKPLRRELRSMNRVMRRLRRLMHKADAHWFGRRVGRVRERLANLMKRRERIDDRLERAISLRDRRIEHRREIAGGLRSSIFAQRELVGGFGIDRDGSFSAGDIAGQLEKNLEKTRKFQRLLRKLRRRGFRANIIGQVAQAGPDEGMETAEALAGADRSEVRRINKSFVGIHKVAHGFSREIGRKLYGAGIQAARGLVKGLRDRRRQINRTMRHIARSLIRHMRRSLKIQSPSKEMESIGDLTGKGFVSGLEKSLPGARQVMDRTTADLTRLRPFNPIQHGGYGRGGDVHIREVNVNINKPVGDVADFTHQLRYALRTNDTLRREVKKMMTNN